MPFITKTFYTQDDLARHLKAHQPSFYFSSQTSTVIPYDKLQTLLPWQTEKDYFLCDISKLPTHMEIRANGNLVLRGGVSWEEAKKFLRSQGRNLKLLRPSNWPSSRPGWPLRAPESAALLSETCAHKWCA